MKKRIKMLIAAGLSVVMLTSAAGCGKRERMEAEINPDTPVSEVSFPLKEQAELSFITNAPATSTQDPNERVIFQRMEEQTNVHIDWTCFVADQFADKKNLALAQFGNLPDGLFNAGMNDYDLLRYAKQGIIIPWKISLTNICLIFRRYSNSIRNTGQCVQHRTDIFTHSHGSNSWGQEKRLFRQLETFPISTKNGWII